MGITMITAPAAAVMTTRMGMWPSPPRPMSMGRHATTIMIIMDAIATRMAMITPTPRSRPR